MPETREMLSKLLEGDERAIDAIILNPPPIAFIDIADFRDALEQTRATRHEDWAVFRQRVHLTAGLRKPERLPLLERLLGELDYELPCVRSMGTNPFLVDPSCWGRVWSAIERRLQSRLSPDQLPRGCGDTGAVEVGTRLVVMCDLSSAFLRCRTV